MKKVLLQLTFDPEANQLLIGLEPNLSENTKEYIMATLELIGNKIMQDLSTIKSE